MINFAHRGASADYPENTLLAFEEGIKCGASGIELDVQKTKDNKIVVIHDEEVERTFKGKGLVKDFTLRELKELQTRRALFEGVQGTGIPTLEEVLNLIRNSDVILNIELKTDMIHYAGIDQDEINMIEDYEMKERVIISSFNPDSIKLCKQIDGEIKTGLLYYEPIENIVKVPLISSITVSGFNTFCNFYPKLTYNIEVGHGEVGFKGCGLMDKNN